MFVLMRSLLTALPDLRKRITQRVFLEIWGCIVYEWLKICQLMVDKVKRSGYVLNRLFLMCRDHSVAQQPKGRIIKQTNNSAV